MPDVAEIVKDGLIGGAVLTLVNPVVQKWGGNLDISELAYQELKALFFGGAFFALPEVMRYFNIINLPSEVSLYFGLFGINLAGLFEKENNQNWVTVAGISAGAIAGFALSELGWNLNGVFNYLKEGVEFIEWAIKTASKVKFPKIPTNLP